MHLNELHLDHLYILPSKKNFYFLLDLVLIVFDGECSHPFHILVVEGILTKDFKDVTVYTVFLRKCKTLDLCL